MKRKGYLTKEDLIRQVERGEKGSLGMRIARRELAYLYRLWSGEKTSHQKKGDEIKEK